MNSSTAAESDPPAATASLDFRLLLLLGALTAFGALSIDMYLPAFPQITADLGGKGAAPVEATLAVFLASMGISQALYGPISDRFGRRAPLLSGAILFILGAAGCALAPSMNWLVGARFVQGLGGAAGIVIARAVVRDLNDEAGVARTFSQLMLVMGAAPLLAPWIGGQLLALGSWRAIFLLLTGFGIACLLSVVRVLPETLPPSRRVVGGVPRAFRNFRSLLVDHDFRGYLIASGLNYGTMFAYIAGSPHLLIDLYGISPQHYGFIFGGNALGLISAAQLNRLLLKRWKPEQILSAALMANASCGVLLAACGLTGWGGFPVTVALLFCCLASIGLAFPNLAAAALAPHGALAGSASSLLGAAQFGIGGVAGAVIGLFHNNTAAPMTLVMAFCGVGAVAALRLVGNPETKPAR